MKLLIVTQRIDETDSNLGFFVRWVEEFGRHTSQVTVICLEEGRYHLPPHVPVHSLGKGQLEIGNRKLKILRRTFYAFRFMHYVWSRRRSYDAVFVHMNPEYLLLGGGLWRLLGKKVGFWYTHQSRRFLRSALLFVDHVFTPSLDSFPIQTKKAQIVGHGVDTEVFLPRLRDPSPSSPPVILSDTRITPSKHVERTLEISRELQRRGVPHTFQIIGAPITKEDKAYEKRLKEEVRKENLPILFVGGVPFALVPDYYGKADIFINHANVGALNKTVLQAMAMNLPVITSNESYRGILPDTEIVREDPVAFADKIQKRLSTPSWVSYRERILKEHSLQTLIPKILHCYKHE